jgi:hypothetical protein
MQTSDKTREVSAVFMANDLPKDTKICEEKIWEKLGKIWKVGI